MAFDNRPIGVFDSGIGGLSVLSHLIQNFPNESFVYLGDTARLPYGSKSPQTIKHYVTQNINYLLSHHDVKAVIIACNSASTVLRDPDFSLIFKSKLNHIFGVIRPGSQAANALTQNNKIAIWATRATIKQDSYKKTLQELNPKIECVSVACPLLVPLVEEGLWQGPITDAVIDLYLKQLDETDVDTLVLGCTHYPFIKSTIENRIKTHLDSNSDVSERYILNPKLKIADSGLAVSNHLIQTFQSQTLLEADPEMNTQANEPELRLLLTDEASHFMDLVLKAFPGWKNVKFQLIDLHQIV